MRVWELVTLTDLVDLVDLVVVPTVPACLRSSVAFDMPLTTFLVVVDFTAAFVFQARAAILDLDGLDGTTLIIFHGAEAGFEAICSMVGFLWYCEMCKGSRDLERHMFKHNELWCDCPFPSSETQRWHVNHLISLRRYSLWNTCM